jgi:hypothetical protein
VQLGGLRDGVLFSALGRSAKGWLHYEFVDVWIIVPFVFESFYCRIPEFAMKHLHTVSLLVFLGFAVARDVSYVTDLAILTSLV